MNNFYKSNRNRKFKMFNNLINVKKTIRSFNKNNKNINVYFKSNTNLKIKKTILHSRIVFKNKKIFKNKKVKISIIIDELPVFYDSIGDIIMKNTEEYENEYNLYNTNKKISNTKIDDKDNDADENKNEDDNDENKNEDDEDETSNTKIDDKDKNDDGEESDYEFI